MHPSTMNLSQSEERSLRRLQLFSNLIGVFEYICVILWIYLENNNYHFSNR